MDARIIEALRKLGLSEEVIAEFAAMVGNVRERIQSDGMITRKRDDHPAKRRKLVVKYRPTGKVAKPNYSATADRSLKAIEKQQSRPVQKRAGRAWGPPARRQLEPGPDASEFVKLRYRAAQRIQRLTGKTGAQAAADTMRSVDGIGPIKRR